MPEDNATLAPDTAGLGDDGPAARLARLWRDGRRPDLGRFLAGLGSLSPAQRAAVVRVDQRERWLAGDRVPAEAYLAAHPALHADPEAALAVVQGEFLLRQELGRQPSLDAYVRRFPRYAEPLRQRIGAAAAAGAGPATTTVGLATDPGRTATYSGSAPARPRPAGGPPSVPGYEILGELGRGGMGVVYKARQTALNRLVALKMVLTGAHAAPEELERFRAEALAVARLQHPNLVQIYEVGDHDGLPYFSLEFVTGGTLARQLAHTPQPPREAARTVRALAGAVQYAHEQGVVHRDLKPANVLMSPVPGPLPLARNDLGPGTRDGGLIPKITDFGLAKRLDADSAQTRTGAVMGTPSYMAPEQAAGLTREIGPSVDTYALGAILYEMLTGRPPFRGTSVYDTLEQVRAREPVPPSHLVPSVPRDLETACLKCLQKEPAKRYASAAELAEDLRRFLDGEPIRARRTPAWERTWKWARRRPALAGLAAVSALAAVAVVALAVGLLASNAELSQTNGRLTKANDDLAEQTTKALDAAADAKKSQRLARDRAVRLSVGNGVRLLNDGDLTAALPWFVAARGDDRRDATDADDAARAAAHRARVESALWQCPRLARLWAFDEEPCSAAFSPDGGLLRVVLPQRVEVYDPATGKPAAPPLKFDHRVRSALFVPGGRRLAVAADADALSKSAEVRVWDPDTNRVALALKVEGDLILALPSPDGGRLLTVVGRGADEGKGEDLRLESRVWDAATGRPVSPPVTHPNAQLWPIFSPEAAPVATFSPDGRHVLTRTSNRAHVWDAVTGQPAYPPLRHARDYLIRHAAFSPDGRYVVTSGSEAGAVSIRVWDAAAGKTLRMIATGWSADHMAFSPDGRFLVAVGGTDPTAGEAGAWEVATGRPWARPWRAGGTAGQAACSPNGDWALTADKQGLVRVWWSGTGGPVTPPLRFGGEVNSAAFSPDGRFLLAAGADGTVRLWDLVPARPATVPLRERVGRPDDSFGLTRIAPDGRVLTAWSTRPDLPAAGLRGELRLWDGTTGRALGPAVGADGPVGSPAFSPDGRRVAVAGLRGGLTMLDAVSGRVLLTRLAAAGRVVGVGFAPDGRLLAVGDDGRGAAWDVDAKPLPAPVVRYGEGAASAAFSADGRRVVTVQGYTDALVRVWDVAAGAPAGPPLRPGRDTREVALSADGARLLTWYAGLTTTGSARLWDVATGRPVTPPLSHDVPLAQARLSPDGRRIATADGFKARVWDAATGEPITPWLPLREGVIGDVSLSADGTRLWAVAEGDRRVIAAHWELAPLGLPADDAERWAQALTGQRVEGGGTAPLSGAELRDAWDGVTARHPELRDAPAGDVLAWREGASESCVISHQWALALRHLGPLLDARPDDPDLLGRRGQVYAVRGRWKEAAADFVRATGRRPDALPLWKSRVRAQQAAGDLDGCRATCAAILDRFGKTNDPGQAGEAIWACALAPDGVADAAALLRLAERAAAIPAAKDVTRLPRGMALCRAGRYDEAAALLREAEQARAPGTPAVYWAFLALAEARRGRAGEAKPWLDKAARWADALPESAWSARLEIKVLRQEAESPAAGKKP